MPSSPDGQVWLLSPQNQAVLEGKSRKVKNIEISSCIIWMLKFILFFSSCMILGSIIYLFIAYNLIEKRQNIQEDGIVVEGKVIEQETYSSSNDEDYFLRYQFWVNNVRYTGKDEVSYQTYQEKLPQSPIHIRYLPDDPSQSAIADPLTGEIAQTKHLYLFYMTLCCIPLYIFIFIGNGWHFLIIQRHKKILERDGQLLQGKVNGYEVVNDRQDKTKTIGHTLIYTIFLPNGSTAEGSIYLNKVYFPESDLAPIGTPLAIWYAHENLHTPL